MSLLVRAAGVVVKVRERKCGVLWRYQPHLPKFRGLHTQLAKHFPQPYPKMEAVAKKRPLPPKVAAMKARKRRKLEGSNISRNESAAARRTGLKVDSLAWSSVSIPDHLEDYTGLFGLEEVGGVDVVRDLETGQFHYVADQTTKTRPTKEQSDTAKQEPDDEEEDDAYSDAWSGFDEMSKDAEPPKLSQLNGASQTLDNRPKQRKQTGGIEQKQAKSKPQQNVTFQSLLTKDSEPSVDVSAWRSLKLLPDTLAALSSLKFSRPTPIQEATIPEILAGHDVIGKASTGSGKTLAFGIPILEAFLERRESLPRSKEDTKPPLALILSPTRELAHQLDKHLTALCSNGIFESPVVATVTGGLAVQKQQRKLRHADVVIGTPGRLWEVISEGQGIMKALKAIKFLVVDEADRLLSEGHFKEVEEILNALDKNEEGDDDDDKQDDKTDGPVEESAKERSSRQTLVFSATFDRSLQRKLATRKFKPGSNLMDKKDTLAWLLSKLNFREHPPKFIDVNPIKQLATGLKEGLIECGGLEKDLYLYTLLLYHPNFRTLVFANSIAAVKRLTPFLQHLNLLAVGLHGDMPQKARLRSLERFKDGSCSILVATDVAARGLDIPEVHLVIHYHVPRQADTYVHRSGRTARAGLSGFSIMICAPDEVAEVRSLVATVHASSAVTEEQASGGRQGGYYIRTLPIDGKIVSRLKPRAALAKEISDATIAKGRRSKDDEAMRAAAEELGVDYDSEEFETEGNRGRKGRGGERKKKERVAAGLSKGEFGAKKAQLKGLLKQRVNIGVSEKYLTSGRVDVDELLRQQEAGVGQEFLGNVPHGLFD